MDEEVYEAEEIIEEETIEDQAEAIIAQIEEAEDAKYEKIEILLNMVDNRIAHMQEVWGGALGYEETAAKLRLFMGNDGKLNFHQIASIRGKVFNVVNEMAKAFDDARKDSDDIEWIDWLDQWCKTGCFDNVDEVVRELLILDVCQHVWDALRRIPEFVENVDKEIDEMRAQVSELYK